MGFRGREGLMVMVMMMMMMMSRNDIFPRTYLQQNYRLERIAGCGFFGRAGGFGLHV